MTEHDATGSDITRREFVATVSALGAVWFAGAACARDVKSASITLKYFTPAQATDVDAISARIIPTDSTAGAREAGVLYFIDASLTTFAKGQAGLFADGLQTLSTAVRAKHGSTAVFSALTEAQQDTILLSIEKTPFFEAMRFATLSGFLSLPKYGGNKDFVGWKFIGQDNVMEQQPPFGWYDRPDNQRALLGRVL